MSDFRRFYSPGLEHNMHLEELGRSASNSNNQPIRSRQKITILRRWVAQLLTTLAKRIDPLSESHSNKATPALS